MKNDPVALSKPDDPMQNSEIFAVIQPHQQRNKPRDNDLTPFLTPAPNPTQPEAPHLIVDSLLVDLTLATAQPIDHHAPMQIVAMTQERHVLPRVAVTLIELPKPCTLNLILIRVVR